jgi:hypothetical protein
MPVAALIVVRPAIEVKAIEGHSLHTDGKMGECGTHLPIEAVLVHPQISRRISQANEPRRDGRRKWASQLARPINFS